MNGKYLLLLLMVIGHSTFGQTIKFENLTFESKDVEGKVIRYRGESVVEVKRNLKVRNFDSANVTSTVDGPTFLKIKGHSFKNGTIELDVLSFVDEKLNYKDARGFIGVAFRIDANNEHFDAVYLRPGNSRVNDQLRRNHTIQYFSFPDYKFNILREKFNSQYESYADIGLNEWIKMKIEIQDSEVKLYLNGQRHPNFVVPKVLGKTNVGDIGLWVDIGTVGYFKNIKMQPKLDSN